MFYDTVTSGTWKKTVKGRKQLYTDEQEVALQGNGLAAVIEADTKTVDADRLESKVKEAVAQVYAAAGHAAPAWQAPLKIVPGMVVEAAEGNEISLAVVLHQDMDVMHALARYCQEADVVVYGTPLKFVSMQNALADAASRPGRTPAVEWQGNQPAVFCQISGLPPLTDEGMDDVADQLEVTFGSRVTTIYVVKKFDPVTGQRIQHATNGKCRFHVEIPLGGFRMPPRFTIMVRPARLPVPRLVPASV